MNVEPETWTIAPYAPPWHQLAECRGVDVAIFFPPGERRGPLEAGATLEARSYCDRCRVAVECLSDALATPAYLDGHGIRAGLTAGQRARRRRQQRRETA